MVVNLRENRRDATSLRSDEAETVNLDRQQMSGRGRQSRGAEGRSGSGQMVIFFIESRQRGLGRR